jgi:hypothetical protein
MGTDSVLPDHYPLPWRVAKEDENTALDEKGHRVPLPKEGYSILDNHRRLVATVEKQDNAVFLVTAVNSYDSIVSKNRLTQAYVEGYRTRTYSYHEEVLKMKECLCNLQTRIGKMRWMNENELKEESRKLYDIIRVLVF